MTLFQPPFHALDGKWCLFVWLVVISLVLSAVLHASRYGKEDKLVNLFGIMQALVSFVQDDRDNLRSVVAGKHRFVFVCRGPLVLVSVAQARQSETQVRWAVGVGLGLG